MKQFTEDKNIKEQIKTYSNRNKRAGKKSSLTGTFSYLRDLPAFTALGDFVLLSHLVATLPKTLPELRRKIFRVMSHSSELKPLNVRDKRMLVEYLMEVAL